MAVEKDKNIIEDMEGHVPLEPSTESNSTPDEATGDLQEQLEDSSLSDDMWEVQRPFPWKRVSVLIGILSLIGLGIAYVGLYPSIGKIKGEWESTSGTSIQLTVSDSKKASVKFLNYGGNKGLTVLFNGTMVPTGMNGYQLTNITSDILYSKKIMTEKDAAEIKKDNEHYHFLKETTTDYYFELTEEGLKRFIGREYPDNYFNWQLDVPLPWESPRLQLNNSLLSMGWIEFNKQ